MFKKTVINSIEDSKLHLQKQYTHHSISNHQATVDWDTKR